PPGQTCGQFAIQRAQSGHFDEQGEGRDFGDAWNGFQDRKTFGELSVSGEAGCDFFLDGCDPSLDRLAPLGIVLCQTLKAQGLAAVPRRRLILDEGLPRDV
ncbi:MAG: hypothetical protein KTR19_00820, partial [Hyphomicrobiales bacterium]|nr:hypothetical protein [Hyphomicrobiales bacterium]